MPTLDQHWFNVSCLLRISFCILCFWSAHKTRMLRLKRVVSVSWSVCSVLPSCSPRAVSTRCLYNIGLTLAPHLQCWPSIKATRCYTRYTPLFGRREIWRENIHQYPGESTNRTHCTNVGLMLGQRLRRWPNIWLALFECMLFAGESALKARIRRWRKSELSYLTLVILEPYVYTV